MIYTFLVFLHIIISILLVVVILLQSAKGGGLAGSAFGGGSSMAFLGARGTATFLSRATTVLAIIFMLNSLGMSFMLKGSSSAVSVTQQEIQQSAAAGLPRVAGEGESAPAPIQGLPDQSSETESPLTSPIEEGGSSGGN